MVGNASFKCKLSSSPAIAMPEGKRVGIVFLVPHLFTFSFLISDHLAKAQVLFSLTWNIDL